MARTILSKLFDGGFLESPSKLKLCMCPRDESNVKHFNQTLREIHRDEGTFLGPPL